MKKVAIVILNWNGEQMLHRFLPSVLQHSENFADIVVADNASTDASLALLEKEFPTVPVSYTHLTLPTKLEV